MVRLVLLHRLAGPPEAEKETGLCSAEGREGVRGRVFEDQGPELRHDVRLDGGAVPGRHGAQVEGEHDAQQAVSVPGPHLTLLPGLEDQRHHTGPRPQVAEQSTRRGRRSHLCEDDQQPAIRRVQLRLPVLRPRPEPRKGGGQHRQRERG